MTVLSADVRFDAAHPVVRLSGELDLTSSEVLREAIETALACRPATVELDAEALTFCDSQGLRALLQVQHCVTNAGAVLRLTHVHGTFLRVLELTQLDKAFAVDSATGREAGDTRARA
ncbi:STAS domain-containing protein [Nonomuraea dietziae]|uniref:STAS domain-containing protein n=1 Tax=Nonomuraea dietziae TaxID=65515 RepID=UPI003401D6B3